MNARNCRKCGKLFSPLLRRVNRHGNECVRPAPRDPFSQIRRHDVKLDTVIIIDDIYTTGSTIDAMSYELRRAGVKDPPPCTRHKRPHTPAVPYI